MIWLGAEEGNTLEPIIEFARRLATIDRLGLPEDRLARQKALGFKDFHVLSLASLLEKPWFRRIWVVQEVAVARETIIYCGERSLTWEELCSVLTVESGINISGVNNQLVLDIIEGIEFEKRAVSHRTPVTLLHVLLRHRTSLATDLRDKVFAVLGLCTDNILQRDYNLRLEEVHKLLTRAYLLKGYGLNIITVPSDPASQAPSTRPSWVPDWSATDAAFPLALRTELVAELKYRASGQSNWVAEFSEDTSMLKVEAQFIGEVTTLGLVRKPYRPDKPSMKAFFQQLRHECTVSLGWQRICLGNSTSWKDLCITGETLFDVSWQILLAGCSPSEYEACRKQSKKIWKMFRRYLRLFKSIPQWVFGLLDDIAKWTCKTIFLQGILAEAVSNDFQLRVRRSISYRRMMRTSTDYLGLVPALTQIGDRVALLKGLKPPVILRPKEHGWEFVGDCYVHGVMNGEVFQIDKVRDVWLI